jgi:YVTN family beta-propeller protein
VEHTSGSSGSEPQPPERGGTEAAVRTFLIADVRGYTRFTQEHGDEAGGALAASFAELTRETIVAAGGEVIELRGDEALCVFGSARRALRAAVELQLRFRQQTDDGPAFPLPIGIGLDAGEAVPIEGGYRGGALNTAARLCSLAGPGQIFATDTVISLARRVEGIRYLERRPVRLKGLERPVRVIEVVPEAGLPPLPVVAAQKRPRITRSRLAVGAAGGLALVTVVLALILTSGSDFLSRLEANALGAIDGEAAGIASQVPLASAPSSITAGDGFLWVASEDEGTVSRYEPASGAVQTLTLEGAPGGIAYGAGSLWVTKSEERELVQINPKTLADVQTFTVGNGPGPVAVGEDAVWVVNTIDGTLSRIDLAAGSATDPIPVGPSPVGLAVGAGAVWVTSEGDATVVRIDPASRTIVESINVGNGPTGIAVEEGGGGVWVANSQDGTVMRIDPATNSVSDTDRVGAGPSAVTAGRDAVWVGSSRDETITRIDADSGEITKTLTLGSSPKALTLADGKLWAITVLPPAGHRGGVLRIEAAPSACRCVDPAKFAELGSETDVAVPLLLYDGLVTYRHVGGAAGGRLVPNLAVRLPTPTDEGRTYTFRLRGGLRYSDGAPVRATDFRASVERQLTINPAFRPYQGIAGAEKCPAGRRKRCDLSKGIEVDDEAGTITIRLTEPDPEFLYKLALPLASLVPATTPLRAATGRPIPGTGPYRLASFRPGREIRLVRNEHFHVWSAEARPDGYPDEIRFHQNDDAAARLTAVEKGTADWVSLGSPELPPERQRGVLTRYADRLHIDPLPQTNWWFLNTRVPPFDDVRVRRALNYAIDRKALVELTGGRARETCQILPPSFPGYRPYCPYTRNPNPAGTWTAPNLAKARALVAASGTAGMRVEVPIADDPVVARISRYFVSLLQQLGYRTSLRLGEARTFEDYVAYVADSRNRAQLGGAGWRADTLAASNFFQPLFTCAAFVPKSPHNTNWFEYCNPRLDDKMKEATALQTSDPVRANELWAEIDRAIVNQAVAVPFGSVRTRILVSERVGNHQSHPNWGTLLDQLWVK